MKELKKTLGALLMWCAFIMLVCECDYLGLFVIVKLVGLLVGWVGYKVMIRNMSEEELNERP